MCYSSRGGAYRTISWRGRERISHCCSVPSLGVPYRCRNRLEDVVFLGPVVWRYVVHLQQQSNEVHQLFELKLQLSDDPPRHAVHEDHHGLVVLRVRQDVVQPVPLLFDFAPQQVLRLAHELLSLLCAAAARSQRLDITERGDDGEREVKLLGIDASELVLLVADELENQFRLFHHEQHGNQVLA